MKMTKLEKRFVNRRKKAQNNIKKVEDALKQINAERIKDVLEIGCGIGLVAAYLANERGFTVYGTDFDSEEIQLAKKFNTENQNLNYQIEDAAKLSFEDNCFDLVISQNVFHHIPNWTNAISEIQRVLRQGGFLIWHDLVFPKIVVKLFKPFTKNYGLYSIIDIRAAYAEAGFDIIDQQKRIHGPFMHCEMVLHRRSI
jgi:ubiquinone/menaquinone biosynthesis C-methylase UbiE